MRSKNKNQTFESADFILSVFLFSKGIPLVELKQINNSIKKIFVFKYQPQLDGLIANFWAKKELVEPIQLLSAQRELKRRLHFEIDRHEE